MARSFWETACQPNPGETDRDREGGAADRDITEYYNSKSEWLIIVWLHRDIMGSASW
jgi:hypothetical protein